MIGSGRIVKAAQREPALEAVPTASSTPAGQAIAASRTRIVPRSVAAAHQEAADIKRRALAEAAELRAQAEAQVHSLRQQAAADGRAAGYAEVLGLLLKQRAREADLESAAQARVITVARLLAERIIGHALEVTPALLGDMALSALNEVRGARQVQLVIHPADEPQIAPRIAALRLPAASINVVCDASLKSGQLRILTELGGFEANLGRRLDLLCEALSAPSTV